MRVDERTKFEALQRITELETELRDLRARAGFVSPTSEARIAEVMGDVRILELVPEFITITDRSLRIAYLNRVRGAYQRSAIIGMPFALLLPPEDTARVTAMFEEVFAGGGAREVEFRSREGSEFVSHMVPVYDGDEVAFVVSIARDVTEARAAERALRDGEARLRLAIRASGMGTWSWKVGTSDVEWDDTLCRIFGVDESSGRVDVDTYIGFVAPDDRERVMASIDEAVASGVYQDLEHRIVLRDGTERWLLCKGEAVRDERGSVTGLRGGVFDVTERHAFESRVREAQKMEAVGRLTAGIAHNFNNMLGVILPSVELARVGDPSKVASRLDDIEHAALRASEMVRELMLFARGTGKPELRSVDLAALTSRTVSICRATFGPAIAIELRMPMPIPPVAANANQLEQVLLNVILNARDALEEGRSAAPTIVVELSPKQPDSVQIRIEDNGPGMDERTRASVFEPFFTTKAGGRGTGLGLSSAYAVVVEHGGTIECESRLGAGTTFRIELPIGDASLPPESLERELRATHRGERILVVDDEESMRRVVRGILEAAGYSVVEAASGEEAVARVAEGPGFDLSVVDRTMPGLAGDALIDALRRRSDMPIVVLTGDPSGITHPSTAAVLAKPISSRQLLSAVRQVLDARRTA